MSKSEIYTEDGVKLICELYKAQQAKAVVMVNPGTATKTSFYIPFAKYLTENGYHVILWNYRGFCDSKSHNLAGCAYTFSDIGHYDIPAVIAYAKKLFPVLPLYCVGHSTGGQQVGLAHNYAEIEGLIAVATSAGYFAYMPFSYRMKAYFFFYFFAPVTNFLFNYVPASKWKFMEDLPSGFYREWKKWCQQKELFFSEKVYGKNINKSNFKKFLVPTFVISAEDDEISTRRNIHNFWKNVEPKNKIEFFRYDNSALHQVKIGHFGYFRKDNTFIWQDILQRLDSFNSSRK